MGMVVGVAEFLEKVGKLKSNKEKVEALKYNDSLILRMVLQGAYDPDVVWALPSGVPPYKPNELVDQEHILIKEGVRKIPYFIQSLYPNMNQLKRETMFVEFLESLAPADALLICAIKDKNMPTNIRVPDHVVREAFPDMIKSKAKATPIISKESTESNVQVEA